VRGERCLGNLWSRRWRKRSRTCSNLLRKGPKNFQKSRIFEVSEIGEARDLLSEREGIVKIPWCGKEECGGKLEDETGGDILGREIDGEKKSGKCPICGEESGEPVLMAKTY